MSVERVPDLGAGGGREVERLICFGVAVTAADVEEAPGTTT